MEEIRDWNREHFNATTVFHFNHSLRPFIWVADIYFVDLHDNEYYTFDDIAEGWTGLEFYTKEDDENFKGVAIMGEIDF